MAAVTAVLLSEDIRRNGGERGSTESQRKMCDPSRAEARRRIPIDLTASGHINSARCVRRRKIEHNVVRGERPPRTAKR